MSDQPGPSGSGNGQTDEERSRTLAELIAMQENEGAIPVIPKSWCPHLEDNVSKDIREFGPEVKLSEQPCLQCGEDDQGKCG